MKTAERFGLVALEVSGLRVLSGEDVLVASGLAVGDNIFAVDLDAVALRLESLVWVREARLERKPPDRLIVRVGERRRAAWIDVGGKLYGVDPVGVLLPEEAMPAETATDLDLPVIKNVQVIDARVGTGGGAVVAGHQITDSTLVAMLDWWRQARAHDDGFSAQISELQPFGTDALRVILGGDGLEIRLPLQGVLLKEHLRTLNRALPIVYADCARPGYIDLRFAQQLVVGQLTATDERRAAPAPRARQTAGAKLTRRLTVPPEKERRHNG